MGISDQDSEGSAQPGRRPTLDSLLAEDDGKSRDREGFVIRPVEILRLLRLRSHKKHLMQVLRSARSLGLEKHQWSSRKGYLVHDAIQIFEDVGRRNNKSYRVNRAHWYEIEMGNAARDLGGNGVTFSEAATILGIPPITRTSERVADLFPFGRHPKQFLYDTWLTQPIVHIDDLREAYGHERDA